MGFSVSGATVILFLAVLVGGLALTSALESASEARNAGVDAEEQRILDRVNADINATAAVYDGGANELEVTAENTGSVALDLNETDILVDGVFETPVSLAVEGNTDRALWTPGTNATLVVDGLAQQPDRVKLVTETGAAAVRTNITN